MTPHLRRFCVNHKLWPLDYKLHSPLLLLCSRTIKRMSRQHRPLQSLILTNRRPFTFYLGWLYGQFISYINMCIITYRYKYNNLPKLSCLTSHGLGWSKFFSHRLDIIPPGNCPKVIADESTRRKLHWQCHTCFCNFMFIIRTSGV